MTDLCLWVRRLGKSGAGAKDSAGTAYWPSR